MYAGALIQGKFRVERVLGKGGMGTVVVATHLQLNQRVALKFLHDEMAADAGIVERFLREARAAALLHSDHVCRVTDVGQLESGAPYLVMELLDGEDLAALVGRRPLDIATATSYVLQACIAIAEAHAAGMVHRDLKPSNLFLAKRVVGGPIVKVLDFGIAKAPSSTEFRVTRTSMVMGSPGYMSPEQLRSAKDADARADVWSLGVILYELVSGRLPFPSETITELTMKVAMDPPVPLDADPAYVRVVMRCLEKPLDRRYQSVAELARDLAACGGPGARDLAEAIASFTSLPALAATVPPTVMPDARTQASLAPAPVAPPPPSTTMQQGSGEAQPVARGGRRGLVVGAVLASVVVVAIVAIVLGTRGDGAKGTSAERAPTVGSDAGAVAVTADAPAVAPDAATDVSALRTRCLSLQSSHDWAGLETCGRELGVYDAPAGVDFQLTARTNAAADIKLKVVRDALASGDLPAARRALDAIDPALRVEAEKAYQAAREKQIAAAKAHAATTPPPPQAASTCSPAATEGHRRRGMDQMSSGNYSAALVEFEAELTCDPNARSRAYLAACRSHDFARAKKLFQGLSESLAQICLKEGFDPRT